MRARTEVVVAAVALAAVLTAVDLLGDGWDLTAPGVIGDFAEKLILVGAMVAAARVSLRLSAVEDETEALRRDVARAAEDGEAWRADSRRLLDGLGHAIAAQFGAWSLSPAEADIAGLLLKGLPLKDIARLRRTSEATIRQQAQSVYRKSGLGSRAELAAYFLDDLFAVAEETARTPAPLRETG